MRTFLLALLMVSMAGAQTPLPSTAHTRQLLRATDGVSARRTIGGDQQSTLLFYHNFGGWADQVGINSFTSDSGHLVACSNIIATGASAGQANAVTNYVTNGWFSFHNFNMAEAGNYLGVVLTNLEADPSIIVGARIRYRLIKLGTDYDLPRFPRRDSFGIHLAYVGFPLYAAKANSLLLNPLGTGNEDTMWADYYVSAAITETFIPNYSHPRILDLHNTNRVNGFIVETGLMGDGMAFIDVDGTAQYGFSTNLNIGKFSGTNIWWLIHQHTNRTHNCEVREIWVRKAHNPSKLLSWPVATTNVEIATNIVLNLNVPTQRFYLTNDATFVSFKGLQVSEGTVEKQVRIELVPVGGNRSVTWPMGSQYGVRMMTNFPSELWQSVTQGFRYIYDLRVRGTNIWGRCEQYQ